MISLYPASSIAEVRTIAKWKERDSTEDRSHRPHELATTLSAGQEAVVADIRRLALIPLDDLLVVVREFIDTAVSRSGLDRCLRRHGLTKLSALRSQARKAAGDTKPELRSFKDYEPGFIHVDVKYLPQMPDEASRRYLFVAIDHATRWVFLRVYADQGEDSSVDFLRRLYKAAPMKIDKVLTDNGGQFTDRFTRAGSASHLGSTSSMCLARPSPSSTGVARHPQTNGMVERFNGRISEVVKQTRFTSAAQLAQTLTAYLKTCNQCILQRALGHQTPLEALKQWQTE